MSEKKYDFKQPISPAPEISAERLEQIARIPAQAILSHIQFFPFRPDKIYNYTPQALFERMFKSGLGLGDQDFASLKKIASESGDNNAVHIGEVTDLAKTYAAYRTNISLSDTFTYHCPPSEEEKLKKLERYHDRFLEMYKGQENMSFVFSVVDRAIEQEIDLAAFKQWKAGLAEKVGDSAQEITEFSAATSPKREEERDQFAAFR